jgi:hypothetical protein
MINRFLWVDSSRSFEIIPSQKARLSEYLLENDLDELHLTSVNYR